MRATVMSEAAPGLLDRAAELRRAFDGSFAERTRLDGAPQEDLLAIRVASEPYAIRCAEITGLFADKKVTRVPSGAAALHGIGGFRGTIVPVYSLAALLGHPMTAIPRWIVIASGLPVALAFEVLDGHLRMSRDEILPRDADERARKYVQHFMREQDHVRAIVHLPSVLDAIREQGPESAASEER
jgi:chemotaxis signal transduction protein